MSGGKNEPGASCQDAPGSFCDEEENGALLTCAGYLRCLLEIPAHLLDDANAARRPHAFADIVYKRQGLEADLVAQAAVIELVVQVGKPGIDTQRMFDQPRRARVLTPDHVTRDPAEIARCADGVAFPRYARSLIHRADDLANGRRLRAGRHVVGVECK